MPDEVEAQQKAFRDLLGMLYATFLRDFALQSALVSKGLLTNAEVDACYKTLSETPQMRGFRQRLGIADSELTRVLERLLQSFAGPIQ